MEWNHNVDVHEGGYCRGGVGDVSNFIIGDDGSSFLTLITPLGHHSWFLQTSPDTSNSAFLINSLFNQTNFLLFLYSSATSPLSLYPFVVRKVFVI